MANLLKTRKVVTLIDVLVGTGALARARNHLQSHAPVALPRILRFHAHDLNLVLSTTVHLRHGKGRKHRLRFTKMGDAGLEAAYATYFVWPGKSSIHPPVPPEPCGRRQS